MGRTTRRWPFMPPTRSSMPPVTLRASMVCFTRCKRCYSRLAPWEPTAAKSTSADRKRSCRKRFATTPAGRKRTGSAMDETYRMLGREHEADLEREAAKWRLADQARKRREKAGSGLLQRLIPRAPSRPGRTLFVRSLRNIAVRLGVVSSVCLTLLTLAAANIAHARSLLGTHSPAGAGRAAAATYLDAASRPRSRSHGRHFGP